MIQYNWPNRAEWAEKRRTLFMDEVRDVSTALADYASPQEIARPRQEMRSRWRVLGREMKRNGVNRDDIADKRRSVNRGFKLIVGGTGNARTKKISPPTLSGLTERLARANYRTNSTG